MNDWQQCRTSSWRPKACADSRPPAQEALSRLLNASLCCRLPCSWLIADERSNLRTGPSSWLRWCSCMKRHGPSTRETGCKTKYKIMQSAHAVAHTDRQNSHTESSSGLDVCIVAPSVALYRAVTFHTPTATMSLANTLESLKISSPNLLQMHCIESQNKIYAPRPCLQKH